MNLFREQSAILIFLLLFSGYQAAERIEGNGGIYAQDDKEPGLNDYRLPKSVIPSNYEVMLSPNLENNTEFTGIVHINAYVEKPTDTITFHVGQMEILMTKVLSDRILKEISNSTYNNKTEKYEIKLKDVLPAGTSITIFLDYTGTLRDDMIGFYRSSYVDSNGKIRRLLSTQFQTTHARHAFPCFDEPSFKATFTIRILRPEEYTSLSNMPLNRSEKVDGSNKFWDEFVQSIPMSTYLVAFIISDFEYKKMENFKVWARPNAIDQAKYAVFIGTEGLKYLSSQFNQDYQIAKMDMVAVPDFSAGAMENWGLVTYRESRLLYDEETTSDVAKQSIASVIVHELTHMWFGNQVTPEWWSYLWLSEAFARYFQYFGTGRLEPKWNMEEQFVVEQQQTAYASDGLESSQPMTRIVSTTSQISGVGDTITYNKGGSIVRMMNLIFGSEVFDAGLQNYLKNNDKVARPENLWEELQKEIDNSEEQLNTTVKEIMTTWTEQAGYPVLNVSINNNVAVLKQQRFLLRNLKSTPTNATWWIPLTWATKENPNFNRINVAHWMSKEQETIQLGKATDWVIFNVQSSGFYRVNYDLDHWTLITNLLNSGDYKQIHVLNRAALIDDLLNLARVDLISYKVALDGLQYLTQETNYLPYKAAFSGLTYIDQRASGDDEFYGQFQKFVLNLIQDTYQQLGYADRASDDRLTVLLRGEMNKWACNYGHKGCIEHFTRLFQQMKNYRMAIKPNQQPVAYCIGMKNGNKEDWEFLWNKYYNSNSATEQEVLLKALACTEDTALLERYLLYALEDFETSRIRLQDNSAVFSAVSGSGKAGAEFVLNFVAKHYAQMIKFYKEAGPISGILSTASQRFSTQGLVEKFESLIKERRVEFGSISKALDNSLQIAKYELQWLKKYGQIVSQWVNEFNDEQQDDGTADTTNYRLPTNIAPASYIVSVATDLNELDNFTFTGTVNINAVVKSKTKNITLHSAELNHDNISVLVENKSVKIAKTYVNTIYDFLIIELDQELQVAEKLDIAIQFTGHLNEEMRGFYRSWYLDDQNQTRWLAATHMEPVGARKMFPCFDEPAMKATFTITATVPQNYTVISNMPVNHMYILRDERKTFNFKETPKMSSYLVALVISDFAPLKDEDEVFGVWARRNAINNGEYALSLMKPLVKFYQQTLDFPYQLPKLDMVALPDFVSGAMENWGLLTYKERNVLYDSQLSTTASEQSIINVIAHEITHQWFGNLVSPQWWKYVWLNEGFARYLQYFGAKSIKTDWSLESQFIVDQMHTAFEVDSGSSHAMSHDVYSPTEIRAIFDSITYNKAASVIRMMEKLVGSKVFYNSLQRYLKNRQYDAATPTDLFDAFKEEISDEQLKNSFHDIMNSWTTKPGFPVVHATIENNVLKLKQERFVLIPQDATPGSTWHIPITWTSLKNPNFTDLEVKYWLKDAEASIPLPNDDVYVLNLQQSGFYRVNYDVQTWQKIIKFLKSHERVAMHEINRAAIIDDLLNLGRTGYVDYSIVLSAAEYLKYESNYIPWRAFFNGLTYLSKQFELKYGYSAFRRYVSSLITPMYNKLEFEDGEDDTHVTKLFRSHVRSWACKLDIGDCKAKALSLPWDDPNQYLANVRSVQYCTLAEQNRKYHWSDLWKLYRETKFAAQKSIILQSFACATSSKYLNNLLDEAITKESGIRFEDSAGVFTSVINAHPTGVETVIKFVENNYDKMLHYYKGESTIHSIVTTIEKKIFTDEIYMQYINLLNWLQKRKFNATTFATIDMTLAEYQLKWAEQYVPKIYEWLETNYPSESYRLPTLSSPLRYNISLSTYFGERNFTFNGHVRIDVKHMQHAYASSIVLHAYELQINKVSVYDKIESLPAETELKVTSLRQNNDTQMLTIFLERFIRGTTITIDIDYTGYLNDKLEGFYRSSYKDVEGVTRWLATTQFEPTHARQAFPCFDEPRYKAKFIINIERPRDYMVLSNMPRAALVSSTSGRVWESFNESLPMSTYLVAFVVSDFSFVKVDYGSVNVWGRPELIIHGELAQIAAMRLLDYVYLKTGIPYSLPKLDLVAIPDLSFGAMENWGLATFREYGIYYHHNITSDKNMDYIITIIAHELAHMVYGNLVTCDWWDYVWLNEGFAQYMQWELAHYFRMPFDYPDLFVVEELHPALLNDNSPTTHSMNSPVIKPNEIKNKFDTVTYGKSASVIRMIAKSFESFQIFFRATHRYLRQHQFNTTTPTDLWAAFDTAIKEENALNGWNISMKALMDGWTNVAGYPVVSAELHDSYVLLTQRSFYTYERIDSFWIPITLTTATQRNFFNTSPNFWLGGYSRTIAIDNPNDWFIVNIQQSGYYRVNYDKKSWGRLIEALRNNYWAIYPINRAQIIDDLFNLARVGHVNYEIALSATTYMKKELEYLPWKAFFAGMSFILQRFDGQKGKDIVENYVNSLADRMLKELGFKDLNDTHEDNLSRDLILSWTCKLNHEQCVETALKLFKEWKEKGDNKISPNARSAVYCTAIRNNSESNWQFLWDTFIKTEFPSERRIMLNAFGCSNETQLLDQYLLNATERSGMRFLRRQEVSEAFASVYNAGELGVNVVLDFLTYHHMRVYEYFGDWKEVETIISKIASRISNQKQITKLCQFNIKVEVDLPSVPNAIRSAWENLAWYEKYSHNIITWINAQNKNDTQDNAAVSVIANSLCIVSTTVFSIIMYIRSS